jgi:hypothetical protein
MPKDEFDFEDPMELNGVGLVCEEDTTEAMAECFIEEFMRLGYNHKQLLALFRNPHYIGMNLVMQNRGEPFVREKISEVFARWGRQVQWAGGTESNLKPASINNSQREVTDGNEPGPEPGRNPPLTDPMGAPIPDLPV